jgi:predicted O-methyltransferase YrrM
MLMRAFRAVTDPTSFWREVLRYGILDKRQHPKEWQLFRTTMARMFSLRRPLRSALRETPINEFVPSAYEEAIALFPIAEVPFNVTLYELTVICTIARSLNARCIIEFGTFDGRTTLHLAANAPQARIITFDITEGCFYFGENSPFFAPTKVGQCFADHPLSERITQVVADTTKYDFSNMRASADLVFVDGDHSFDAVLADSRSAFDLIRPGGVVVWHDYRMIADVGRALEQCAGSRELFQIVNTTLVVYRAPPH